MFAATIASLGAFAEKARQVVECCSSSRLEQMRGGQVGLDESEQFVVRVRGFEDGDQGKAGPLMVPERVSYKPLETEESTLAVPSTDSPGGGR